MDLLSLNHDVLDLIIAYLDRLDALHFAETCRTAHGTVMPLVLSRVRLVTVRSSRVIAFCQYMNADPSHRISCMRSLDFDQSYYANLADEVTRPIMAVVSQATQLRDLAIQSMEQLLDKCPEFAGAVSSFTKLRSISLGYIGRRTSQMLSQMQSPLRKLVIKDIHWNPAGALFKPIDHFRGSLEVLEVHNRPLREILDVGRYSWPYVHTLVMLRADADISDLMHAFPALQNLSVIDSELSSKNTAEPTPCPWQRLDTFQTLADTQPSIRIRFPCAIRCISLQWCRAEQDSRCLRADFLPQTAPVVLSCEFYMYERHDETLPDIEYLTRSVPSLKYLACAIGINSESLESFIKWVKYSLCPRLETFSLVGLALTFVTCSTRLTGFDESIAADIALVIAYSVPTLSSIKIKFSTCPPSESFRLALIGGLEYAPSMATLQLSESYRVIPPRAAGDVPELQRLSKQEGEDVARQMLNLGR